MRDAKELFYEFDIHLRKDPQPSQYMESLLPEGIFNKVRPFVMLGDLIKIDQPPEHHPEGNVWNHTMLVLDYAASQKHESKNPRVLMWAALLHDIGKAPTTRMRKGKLTSYDHDKVGAVMAREFLSMLTEEQEFIHKVSTMVKWHMQTLFVVKSLPFADIKGMKREVDIHEIALLTTCDRLGRGKLAEEKIRQELENIRIFKEKCAQQ